MRRSSRARSGPDRTQEAIFEDVRYEDYLVHHPYESFASVESFLRAAVKDPQVIGIKMTLYRIGANSPLIDLLIEAAETGKQVAVLVELKARFDERNNIIWANRLEDAGIHVVYGLVNLKTHCKLCLVVRQETDGIHRYAHIGTGNYNGATAQGLHRLRAVHRRARVLDDVSDVFNYLTGYSNRKAYRELLVAPVSLRSGMRALIEREVAHAKAGRPARLIFKNNAVTDPGMIRTLYRSVAVRRADRSDHARRLLPAPWRPGVSETISGTIDRRPVPRALADLLLRERRRARGVHRQRRSHGAQPRSPRRGACVRSRTRISATICATSSSTPMLRDTDRAYRLLAGRRIRACAARWTASRR